MRNLHIKLRLQPLQLRRKQLRVVFFYRAVEGLVLVIPPEHFLIQRKPGSLVDAHHFGGDFRTQNTLDTYVRDNDRCNTTPHCRTEQLKNFIKTAVDWNHLDKDAAHAKSVHSFKSTVVASLQQ